MNEPWVIVVIAIATLLFGAPVMSALGTWVQSRFGLLKTQVEKAADIASQAREQEYRDLMGFREDQQRAMLNLRLEHRTLKEAFEDLERRHSQLDIDCRSLAEKVERQNAEMERLRTENTTLKSRVSELERENYRLYQQVDQLRKGTTHG